MQKSFHINLVKPFHTNIRKELTKMPKVYFSDLGLRNFFVSNFKPLTKRQDKGKILENATFRQLLEKYPKDKIKFWRTSDQKEIDFVVKNKKAFEVKSNPKSIKKSSYKKFQKEYPDIQLSIISSDINKDKLDIKYPIKEIWEL